MAKPTRATSILKMDVGLLEKRPPHLANRCPFRIGLLASPENPSLINEKRLGFTPAPTELMRVKRINTLPGITPLDYRLKFPLPLVD